jgi:soluble lytic murein transglycosylase-like protein
VLTRHFVAALSAVSVLAVAVPARAEIVFFSTGRTMSVRSHRVEGDSLMLTTRSGGEIVCSLAAVDRIAPDEVPYPEPEEQVSATAGDGRAGITQEPDRDAYREMIDRVAKREGVDARLVRAVIEVESGYRADARSPKGAMGLMQLMPATARQYAVANPYDPASNIDAGIRHLRSLLERFPPALALAAYNAGVAAVERFGGVPPYAETRSYVSRILELARRF